MLLFKMTKEVVLVFPLPPLLDSPLPPRPPLLLVRAFTSSRSEPAEGPAGAAGLDRLKSQPGGRLWFADQPWVFHHSGSLAQSLRRVVVASAGWLAKETPAKGTEYYAGPVLGQDSSVPLLRWPD